MKMSYAELKHHWEKKWSQNGSILEKLLIMIAFNDTCSNKV